MRWKQPGRCARCRFRRPGWCSTAFRRSEAVFPARPLRRAAWSDASALTAREVLELGRIVVEPAALAYVRASDGRYHPVCLTVLSLDADGRIVELTTFVLPELFAAWGFPSVLDA